MQLDVDALLGAAYKGSQEESKPSKQTEVKQPKEQTESPKSSYRRDRSPERKRRRSPSPKRSRRSGSRYKDSRQRSPEKEPAELSPESQAEADARTVFASGLPITAGLKELYEFFEKAGKVKDISLISDRNSRRSKGIGYIQYESRSSIPAALALSNTQLNRHTVTIQATHAEKNRLAATNPTPQPSMSASKVIVSNLDPRLTEADVAYLFEQVGEVDRVTLRSGEDRQAIVSYKRIEDAKKAIEQVNGFKLLNTQLKVESQAPDALFRSPTFSGELDGGDGQGIRMDSRAKLALMNRLNQRASQPIALPVGMQTTISPVVPQPASTPISALAVPQGWRSTTCLVLKNMFSAQEAEEDPELFQDVEDSVVEETEKFGKVLHIFLDKVTSLVYVKLDSIRAAEQTFDLLNGRWFAGKQVVVEYLPEPSYNSKFQLK